MPRTDDWFHEPDLEPTTEPWDFPLERQRKRKRTALTATFVMLFFAGAAFTAGAGDLAANKLQGSDQCAQQANAPSVADDQTCAAASSDAAPPADPAPPAAPADPAQPADPAAPAPDNSAPAPAAAPDSGDPQASNLGSAGKQGGGGSSAPAPAVASGGSKAPKATGSRHSSSVKRTRHEASAKLKRWLAAKQKHAAPAPEIEGVGRPVIWLNEALPDPTPPAKRLTGAFATQLVSDAKAAGVDWSLVLGALRASGDLSSAPATNGELQQLSQRLVSLGAAKDEWGAALALDGSSTFADQAVALAHYDRAVGLWALVHGLEAAKKPLTAKILNDPSIAIYAGGRSDLDLGRVDVRVIALIAYLRETFGSVTVSCLFSGHRLYARPGVISAHIYGRAVDISAVGGTSILGNQEPGGITEKTVRAILLLPSELQPLQVISLLGLGGPSFPLADHYNHIHVGY